MSRDINKAIYYFSLAANQNHPQAQYNLGVIYYTNQYILRDINKAIYYFSLAANQNHPEAQFNLGVIYYEGQYISRDINKATHYFYDIREFSGLRRKIDRSSQILSQKFFPLK